MAKKHTKKALFASVMSLVLCFAMLVGTTFAWFTDSVTSDVNQINAGNLDVELLRDGKPITEDDKLFLDVNQQEITWWEPGVVAYTNIRVNNAGTLALKYNMTINVTDVNKTADTGLSLCDVLKVAVIKGGVKGATREAVLGETKTVQSFALETFHESGKLYPAGSTLVNEPSQSEVYGLVVYWPDNNTNEFDNQFNMNNGKKTDNGKALHITLGLNLTATQLAAESDAFGPDYDADAWDDAMVVLTAEDLAAAVANGGKIMLGEDVELTEALVIPAGITVELNLNGKTLSNAADYIFENNGNLTIDGNGTATGMGIIRSYSGTVTINGGNYYASSKWQDSAYQHTLKAVNSNVVINGGNFDATVNGQSNAMLNASENAIITINGGNFKNVTGELTQFDPYIATYEKNGQIVIKDGTFYGGWRFNGETATTDIYGGDFTVGFDGQSFHANSNHKVTVHGGTFNTADKAGLTQKVNSGEILAEGYEAVATGNALTVRYSQESFEGLIANPVNGVVNIPAGTYTFPNNIDADVEVINANGAVFEGTSNLNINGATVIGATFSNEDGQAVSGTIDGTFKNCVFEGSEALRWCYTDADDEAVFENCVIETDFRGFHFDDMKGNVIFRNCEINGFNAYSGTGTITFEDCKFGNDASSYNGLNIYSNTKLIDCTFEFVSGKTNFIDMEGTGKTLNITNCAATLDGAPANVIDFVGGSKLTENTLVVDGTELTKSADGLCIDADGNYYIYNAAGLQSLNNLFSDGAFGHAIWGKTYNVMADIDASDLTWSTVNLNTPSNDCIGFTIDGNGHTISGLKISGNGLFTSTANGKNAEGPAIFKKLTFDNVSVEGEYHVGILWGQMYGDILVENVHVKNSAVTGTCNVGALVGRNGDEGASTATYKNCSVTNTTITATGNGDPNGASVFQGSALTSNSATVTIKIEGCNHSDNTLKSAEGQDGGGIYACWDASTNETRVVY